MLARLFFGIAVVAMNLTVAIGSGSDAVANPLEFRGPPVQVHVWPIIPVIPTQPAIAEAINTNFNRIHFDVTNDPDEVPPRQSRDEDDDGEEDNLENIFDLPNINDCAKQ